MTALQNFKNREQHLSAGAIFSPEMNEPLITYNGQYYTYEEFNSMFPVDHFDVAPRSLKGENSDKTKSWMKS